MRINGWRVPALALAVLAVLASAALLFNLRLPFGSSAPRTKVSPLRADLIDALGGVRLTEARLSGFGYAPFQGGRGGSLCQACIPIARAIARQAEMQPTAVALADLGLEQLAASHLRAAVGTLERAAARNPDDPVAANDLAAAYIAEARAERHPGYLLHALETLAGPRRALAEARFNRALSLELLQLRGEATEAWHRYMAEEPEASWRGEAQHRLSFLETPGYAMAWKTQRPLLEASALRGDSAAVVKITGSYRQEVRSLAQEQLLPAWAKSHLQGNAVAAAQNLGGVRMLGAALVKLNGEHSIADAVAAIDRANGRPDAGDALARGHLEYAAGWSAFVDLHLKEAKAHFAKAERELRQGGSGAARWAALWLAGADYYAGLHADAALKLEKLLADSEIDRYRALRGRALWLRGLVEMQHMALGRSLAYLSSALRDFEAVGEVENGGALNYLLAENFEMLGEPDKAWQYRERALAALQGYPESIWLHGQLVEAARALLKQGMIHSALAFQNEELRVARRRGKPVTLTEALLLKGRLEAHLGDAVRASRDLEEAGAVATSISDSIMRERLRIDCLVAESQVRGPLEPAAVVAPLARAISYYETSGLGHLAAFCYLLRAKARLALRDDEAAERDLDAGIGAYEAARDALDPEWLRSTYLEQWQSVFDDMILLQAGRRHQPEKALAFAERAKVRLLCGGGGGGALPDGSATDVTLCRDRGSVSLPQIEAALPDRAALIEYALLADRVLIWVVRRDALSLDVVPFKAENVAPEVAAMVGDLRQGGAAGARHEVGAALFDLLLRPVAARLGGIDRLIVVPDKILSALPFAALYDSGRRRYLVEDRVVSIAPSASFFVAKRRIPEVPPSSWRMLAVAPAETAEGETLPALAGAAAEASETAALYPRHRLLTGGMATSSRFRSEVQAADALEFAGHAIANPREPGLSHLIFASDSTVAGPPLLFAGDMRRLALGHLRLVVLSACATAPGSPLRGEGVAGMAQAFMEAGAPAVLASLWQIDDSAAHRVVIDFHRHLLAGEDGANALRSAQLALLHDREESPRQTSDWAAFELIGVLMDPKR